MPGAFTVTLILLATQYNGRVYDPGTGFHDYGARMYWPEIGRFISPDTAGPDPANPATFNRYAYVWNNPYKYTDPDGKNPLLITAGIGAGLGAIYGAWTSYQAEGKVNWTTVINDASIGGMLGLTAGVAGPALAGAIEGSGAAVGAGSAVGAAKAAADRPTVQTTFEILDGVRRSKAAEMAGNSTIRAEVLGSGGEVIDAPLVALRSPKAAIDTAGAGLDRWLTTLRQTLSGSQPPPILVQPGSRGVPIDQVTVK